jgi:hypothetical protein
LIHHTKDVFQRLKTEQRLVIMRNGKVAGVLTAPDPDEALLDQLAADGELPPDWRRGQTELRAIIAAGPLLPSGSTKPSLSQTLIEMRNEDSR